MGEMIERVARAIKAETDTFSSPVHFYISGEARNRYEKEHGCDSAIDAESECKIDFELESYKIIARAAIEAMREPTQRMEDAAFSQTMTIPTRGYTAMIDAALKDWSPYRQPYGNPGHSPGDE